MPITGSREVDDWYRSGYIDHIYLQAMQLESDLSDTVEHIELKGALTMIDRYGTPTLIDGTTRARHADVATDSEIPRDRRSIAPGYWEYPEYFDARDDVNLGMMRQAAQPDSQFSRAVLGSFNAQKDLLIVTAFDGLSYAEDGTTTTAFGSDGGSTIDIGYAGGASSSTGLTVDKVIAAAQTLRTNNAPKAVPWYHALHPDQVTQLFGDTVNSNPDSRLTSADYNVLRPLQAGEPVFYYGLNWRQCTQIAQEASSAFSGDGSSGRYSYVYTRPSVAFGMKGSIRVDVSPVKHKGRSILVFHDAIMNATRVDGAQICRIECFEASA